MRIRTKKVDWGDGVRFYIHDGRHHVRDFVATEQKEYEDVEPTGNLTPEDAQLLMDDLWNCGLRPTEGTGSAGAMAATQNHLKDLQKLVFPGKK